MTDRKDKIKDYDIMLQKHIDKKDFIKINRTFKDREENISGFMLAITRQFILLQVDNEFMLDGYAIIPKDRFDSIRCNNYDKTFKRIYKEEGLLDTQYGFNQSLSLKSWHELFSDLKKLDYHVVIECEDKDDPDFVIGPIKRVTKDKVGVQYYDPTGKLDDKPTTLSYDDITIIKFGDRYSTTFKRHLRKSK
ncbi:hypothetical protein FC093_23045 [Ilyomonas limi]|uniref:Uncharacterized protein n=1 Tax=Ilyomonas limi TaxID=2575867 RepID=A0A4U3KPW1_9BACT|nr:hypothetical protein [Ilyomonas limi]TKK64222.1 hypothetical protein FC093_23045 [Ilyomonas limi]